MSVRSPQSHAQPAQPALDWLADRQFALASTASWRKVGLEYFVVTADRSFHRVKVPTAVCAVERLTHGPATGTELLAMLVGQFAVDDARASQDLQTFLTALHERGVAVATPPPATNTDGAAVPSRAA